MNDLVLYTHPLDGLYQFFQRYVEMSHAEFELVVPFFEVRNFDRKIKLVRIGEVDHYFNIILKGLVRKYMIVKKKEVTTQLSTEGHMIHSEISFNLQQPSDCIVETIEPTTFISISYANLQSVYEKYPNTERLGRLIISDMFIKKDYRDFAQLNKSTRERFVDYLRNHPDMLQRVPQKYLASYLSIKPETFSRLKHLVRPRKNDMIKG